MNKRFKEHFKINGGTFKTHEDEIEAYAKKVAIDFYTSICKSKNIIEIKVKYDEFYNDNKNNKNE